jgi:hypothetical protein
MREQFVDTRFFPRGKSLGRAIVVPFQRLADIEESTVVAGSLANPGVAHLSVMGGTYESFHLPEIVEK